MWFKNKISRNLVLCVDHNYVLCMVWASQMVLVVKSPPANAGDARDTDSIPGSGRSPGGGNCNPLQYSCLENAMDRGAWWATVHRVSKSQTRLKRLSMHMTRFFLLAWRFPGSSLLGRVSVLHPLYGWITFYCVAIDCILFIRYFICC